METDFQQMILTKPDLNEARMKVVQERIADYRTRAKIAWINQKNAPRGSAEQNAARKECLFCAASALRLEEFLEQANAKPS